MTTSQSQLPKWILIVSGIIALMELAVSLQLSCAPESMLEMVDLKATGVDYVVQMWAVRQFALGVIFAFATLKKSAPMLTLAYVFFLVMFLGDLVVGIGQNEISLIAGGAVFTVVSVLMLLVINKRPQYKMTKFIVIASISIVIGVTLGIVIGLNTPNKTSSQKANIMEESKNKTNTETSKDTTPKVTGVGGIFFFSENPKETRDWYSQNLGLETNDYGSTFESRNIDNPEEVNQLQWSPFKQGSDYFAPSKKEFMINYRVQNIEGLVKKLKESGATILDEIATYDYGKFVHILDPEGNKLELWEPADLLEK